MSIVELTKSITVSGKQRVMPRFPFTAIVAQEEMKRALVLAAIDPGLGGVLLFGERGTGKSTAVRALQELMPQITVIKNCRFSCEPGKGDCPDITCSLRAENESIDIQRPLVDLPLGTTEDRLLGSIHLEHAIKTGERVFEPGLLGKAHRGILYVDEVNLLEDSLVDLLLDVLASKENIVEREGLSVRHPAEIVLIGSCNPEEGELRPQLLDRFALSVFLHNEDKVADRAEVVRRRLAFEDDPEECISRFEHETTELREQIATAVENLSHVIIPDSAIEYASKLCSLLQLEGHRGELALIRAARALTSLEGRPVIENKDIAFVSGMCLRHRLRKNPFDQYGSEAKIDDALSTI